MHWPIQNQGYLTISLTINIIIIIFFCPLIVIIAKKLSEET